MNRFCPATMIARTTLGTHNPRISAQTVTHRLREIGERPPYIMYVLYAAFLFLPSIFTGGLKVMSYLCESSSLTVFSMRKGG